MLELQDRLTRAVRRLHDNIQRTEALLTDMGAMEIRKAQAWSAPSDTVQRMRPARFQELV
jgi:hypothetical protein